MPQNDTLSVNSSPIELTNGDVTSIRIQNAGVYSIYIQATVGSASPTDWSGAIRIAPGETILSDTLLSSLFPGISGANRVHAYSEGLSEVRISHA